MDPVKLLIFKELIAIMFNILNNIKHNQYGQ